MTCRASYRFAKGADLVGKLRVDSDGPSVIISVIADEGIMHLQLDLHFAITLLWGARKLSNGMSNKWGQDAFVELRRSTSLREINVELEAETFVTEHGRHDSIVINVYSRTGITDYGIVFFYEHSLPALAEMLSVAVAKSLRCAERWADEGVAEILQRREVETKFHEANAAGSTVQ